MATRAKIMKEEVDCIDLVSRSIFDLYCSEGLEKHEPQSVLFRPQILLCRVGLGDHSSFPHILYA